MSFFALKYKHGMLVEHFYKMSNIVLSYVDVYVDVCVHLYVCEQVFTRVE